MIDIWFLVMWGVIFLAALTGLIVWLVDKSHPYKVRIREVTSGKVRLITDTLAKVKKNKEKVEYLGLMNKRGGHDKLPLPQPEAIDYDAKRKKKVVEAYYSDEIGYTYIEDGGRIKGFDPLTTKQRQMLVNEIHKKEARKVTSWKENIPLIIGLGFLIGLVAIVMIFTPDVLEQYKGIVEKSHQTMIYAEQILDKAALLESGQQVIQEDTPPPI